MSRSRSLSVIAIFEGQKGLLAQQCSTGTVLSESGVLCDFMPLNRDSGLDGRLSADESVYL
jgi:hypothetical protein